MAEHQDTDIRLHAQQALEELLLAYPAVEELLAEAATAAVAGTDRSCGITYLTRYGVLTVASSDARASVVDELQYEADVGPCLQAMRTGEPVWVSDTGAETRWGDYPRLAADAGVGSSLSYPLRAENGPIGAFNLYSGRPRDWSAADEAAVMLLAHQVEGILRALRNIAGDLTENADTARAWADQPNLNIATGVLMAQHCCTGPEARHILHTGAQRRGISDAQAATELIAEADAAAREEQSRHND